MSVLGRYAWKRWLMSQFREKKDSHRLLLGFSCKGAKPGSLVTLSHQPICDVRLLELQFPLSRTVFTVESVRCYALILPLTNPEQDEPNGPIRSYFRGTPKISANARIDINVSIPDDAPMPMNLTLGVWAEIIDPSQIGGKTT